MSQTARGVVAAVIDCLLWAAAALYWPLLQSASDAEILGHRLVWAVLFMACILSATGNVGALRALVRQRRKVVYLVGAAVAITVNWAGFIWGINNGHVVEASLGFFINPLMTVLLGVVLLGEQVRPGQWVAIGLAALAVSVVSIDYGHLPWYALMLAVSGGFYGLFKKKADSGPYESLALETAIVAPAALVYLLLAASTGRATFATHGLDHALLLVGGGLVTVTPLLFFGYAVTRVPLVTLGLVGYLAPLSIFVLGIAHFGETVSTPRLVGFLLVWAALALFAVEAVRTRGRSRVPVGVL